MARNSGDKGGLGSLFVSFFVLIIALGFGLAFLKAKNINNVGDFMTYIHQSSNATGKCFKQTADTQSVACIDKNNASNNSSQDNKSSDTNNPSSTLTDAQLGYDGPKEGQPYLDDSIKKTKEAFTNTLSKLNISNGKTQSFNETSFPHFISSDKNPCWSVKNSILYAQKSEGKFVMQDAYRHETSDMTKACSIKEGTWIDTYTGKKLSVDSANLDFVIPLQYANNHGASSWDNSKKQAFANDKDNFVVASTSAIAKRHGRTPAKWLPDNNKYACVLSKKFVSVANKYSLSITQDDKTALDKAISKCAK